MNPIRRATPDSEALGSSEDERPWPAQPSFGNLPRRENSVHGLPGGIWSTQRKGSFKLSEAAQRNSVREVRLGAPNQQPSALRAADTPSPATSSEGAGSLPFAIPLQPTPKAHRSLSHSHGQRDPPQGASSGGPALPLGLLAEEDNDTDSEDGQGAQLTQTVSQPVPPIGALQRASTYSAYDHLYNGESRNGQLEDMGFNQSGSRNGRTLEAAFANLGFDAPLKRSQWQSHLGWPDLQAVNESRRHSLADIPTRRGSFTSEEQTQQGQMGNCFSSARRQHQLQQTRTSEDDRNTNMRATDSDTKFDIPDLYKVPFVQIGPEETPDGMQPGRRAPSFSGHNTWTAAAGRGGDGSRPRKQLYVVSFKCSRVDIFYLLDNTGLEIQEGDIVIVEADRGQDLGTVQHANVTPDQARLYKRKYAEEQYKWLMMFSRNTEPSNVNPNAQLYGENHARGWTANAPPSMMGMPKENYNNLRPKAIKRLANSHEIRMLSEKEGNEAKAKRACQQKVAHLQLQMEILDAEWQWDFQKLIFYYYADHYINFKDLITELYRIYKTRIWLSAVNPASFSQHALGQPPNAIGPGAITMNNDVNNSYTMAYGADPDPYGAVRPYSIGYDTYTPNYPGIPGMPNSFGGQAGGNTYNQEGGETPSAHPTVQPGAQQTGTMSDYQYYYDRNPTGNGNEPPSLPFTPVETPVPSHPAPHHPGAAQPFNPYSNQPWYANPFAAHAPPATSASPMAPWANSNNAFGRPQPGFGQPQKISPIGTRPAAFDGLGTFPQPSPHQPGMNDAAAKNGQDTSNQYNKTTSNGNTRSAGLRPL
ncbi:hypothetical protein KC327_g12125 [Hortaea werneckii]|uniref:PSP1 C-terminal domain-containing protein n=1 Tax=Hortaea werneckii EXF-2000 TaxID=1157616 RepID=A0A1Z5T2K0_HORWE|nr:hypothetical protein KC327_g12125 [Hortaea werneckii]OTA30107.1 hypothetical protein BTJ68_09267 [Hortaea werneckii EXF-2000]